MGDSVKDMWAGQRSRYSDWLRAGRSGDRIPVGGEIFRTCPDRPWGPSSLLYNGYRVFPRGNERPGRDADPSPPSSAMVIKEQSYTSTPPKGCTAYTQPQCLYKGALYLYPLVTIHISIRGGMSKNTSESGLPLSQRRYEGVQLMSVPRET